MGINDIIREYNLLDALSEVDKAKKVGYKTPKNVAKRLKDAIVEADSRGMTAKEIEFMLQYKLSKSFIYCILKNK